MFFFNFWLFCRSFKSFNYLTSSRILCCIHCFERVVSNWNLEIPFSEPLTLEKKLIAQIIFKAYKIWKQICFQTYKLKLTSEYEEHIILLFRSVSMCQVLEEALFIWYHSVNTPFSKFSFYSKQFFFVLSNRMNKKCVCKIK